MRRFIIAFVCFVFIFGFTGCYDAREISDYAYVITVGIDHGVTDKWSITFQIADFGSESGGGGKSGSGGGLMKYEVVTIDAPSFFAAIDIANTNIPRKLNFEHVSALIFSEDIAKSGDLGVIIAPLIRYWEIRRSENAIVCKGKAMDFIAVNEPFISGTLSKTMEDLVIESRETGLLPQTSLGDLYEGLKSPYKQPIAIYGAVNTGDKFVKSGERYRGGYKKTADYYAGDVPREGGNKIELLGSILADGSKEVGKLTGLETRLRLMLSGDFKRGIFSFPDPEVNGLVIPMEVHLMRQPEIRAEMIDGKVYINVKISLEADIMAIQSRRSYEDPNRLKQLEQYSAGFLKSMLDDLIKKCQDLNCDNLGFSKAVVKCFTWKTVDEWENFNWLKKFKDSRINTQIEFKVNHTSSLLRDSPILYTGGKR